MSKRRQRRIREQLGAPESISSTLEQASDSPWIYPFVVLGGGVAGVSCVTEIARFLSDAFCRARRNGGKYGRTESCVNSESKSVRGGAYVLMVSASQMVKRPHALATITEVLHEISVHEVNGKVFENDINQSAEWLQKDDFIMRRPQQPLREYTESPCNPILEFVHGEVVDVDTNKRCVRVAIEGGRKVEFRFHSVCLCTGASPNPLICDWQGTRDVTAAYRQYVYAVRDSQSVEELASMLSRSRHIMLVGNGGIALEVVHALHSQFAAATSEGKQDGLRVTWVLRDACIGSAFFDRTSSAFLLPFLFTEEDPLLTESQKNPAMLDVELTQKQEQLRNVECHPVNESSKFNSSMEDKKSSQVSRISGGGLGPKWLKKCLLAEGEDGSVSKFFHANRADTDTESAAMEEPEPMSDSKPVLPSERFHIITNAVVRSVKVNDQRESSNLSVRLSGDPGRWVQCDALVNCTGVVPRTAWMKDCNAPLRFGPDGGVSVDGFMRCLAESKGASDEIVPFVYAAGDCCYADFQPDFQNEDSESRKQTSQMEKIGSDVGEYKQYSLWTQMRLWTQAKQMGACAGRVMAEMFYRWTSAEMGRGFDKLGSELLRNIVPSRSFERYYSSVSAIDLRGQERWHRVDLRDNLDLNFVCFDLFAHMTYFFDQPIVLLGRWKGQGMRCDDKDSPDRVVLRCLPNKGEYIKVFLRNHVCVGACLIGKHAVEMAETFQNLIWNQANLERFGDDLLREDVDLDDYFD